MIKCFFVIIFLSLNILNLKAQANNPLTNFDIIQYNFFIKVIENNDSIYGKTTIKANMLNNASDFVLNFKNLDKAKKGMVVESVVNNKNEKLVYSHTNDLLTIKLNNSNSKSIEISINYSGIPTNGLIIGKNKFGNKTWFGDNWPNRAQYWLPCVDNILDKAIVQWTVQVPNKYQVVANGLLQKEININSNEKEWTFYEQNPIPTKVAVIGIANLQKSCSNYNQCTMVCNYYYPETYEMQPYKMDSAVKIIKFYSDLIGEYPFQKLNNVQSTTMFGGMENANNIFYDENAVDASTTMEDLMAHEIAHQWFGNTVTEKDFSNLWLSEGFATFFTNYYIEKKYGIAAFKNRIEDDRKKVIAFLKNNKRMVIDNDNIYMNLLNPNSYQKGGLFLQALREKVGDAIFFKIIRNYYSTYKYKNANTDDFRKIAEQEYKKDLKPFFNEWLYSYTLPSN